MPGMYPAVPYLSDVSTIRDPWSERRVLLEHLLKVFINSGGRVIAPTSTAWNDPACLDNLDVGSVIKQLALPGQPLELARLKVPAASARPIASAASTPAHTPPLPPSHARGLSSSATGNSSEPGLADGGLRNPFRSSGGGGDASNPFASSPGDAGGDASNPFASSAGGADHDPSNPFASSHSPAEDDSNPFASPAAPNPFASSPPTAAAKPGAANGSSGASNSTSNHKHSHSLFGFGRKKSPSPSSKEAARSSSAQPVAGNGGAAAAAAAAAASPAVGRTKLQYSRSAPTQADGDSGKERAPVLDLPQLNTGLDEDELQDLAFSLFMTCCEGSVPPGLSTVMRNQLEIEETHGQDLVRLLQKLGDWKPSQKATLEAPIRLLELVRPADFVRDAPGGGGGGSNQRVAPAAFRAFSRWRDATVAVLQHNLVRNVDEGWTAAHGDSEHARRLISRLRGAGRRMAAGAADFDHVEYAEAVQALADAAKALAAGCRSGWRYPWALRVRVCELLQRALFDTLEESSYIDENVRVSMLLEGCVWPVLGISPMLHLALNAWVHFRQYVVTGDQKLVRQLKHLISKLAAETAKRPEPEDPFNLGADVVGTDSVRAEADQDHRLALQVGRRIVDYTLARFADYHANFPAGEHMPGLLDVLVFAERSLGHGDAAIHDTLRGAVNSSLRAALQRQAEVGREAGPEQRLCTLMGAAGEVLRADERSYQVLLSAHLPHQRAWAAACLHAAVGEEMEPWLREVCRLDDATLPVLRAALQLDAASAEVVAPVVQQLQGQQQQASAEAAAAVSPTAAAAAAWSAAALDAFQRCYRRWDLQTTLQRALTQWVRIQVENMRTWVDRQLQTEKWRPVNAREGYAQSAVEVSKLVHDSIEGLAGLGLPLQRQHVVTLMEGVDSGLQRYARFVQDRLGSPSRLVPPAPPATRYKKEVVNKQEKVETDLANARASALAGKKVKAVEGSVLESVPKIETSPDFQQFSTSLTTPIVACALRSCHLLLMRTDQFTQAMASKWEARRAPDGDDGAGYGGASVHFDRLLSACRSALTATVEAGCKFLATKVVFWDMRGDWFESLYRHHVARARIDDLVDKMNKVLGDLLGPSTPDDLRSLLVRALAVAAGSALQRVLIDGGPCRWFIPADVPLIEQDLIKLKTLFHAEGDGLPTDEIEEALEGVYRLLHPMQLELGPLMELLKAARARGSATLTVHGRAIVYEESELMRLLARRPERLGSKLLKERYKLGKKIK